MAKTYEAPFPQKNRSGAALVQNANTSYGAATANANLVLLFTAGAEDSNVTRITAVPLQTIQPTQIQVWRQKASGQLVLFRSLTMAGYTMATGTGVPVSDFGIDVDNPVKLEAGEKLYAGIALAAATGIQFSAEGEDY